MLPKTRVMKTTIHIQRWGEGPEDKAEEEEEEGRGSNEKRIRDVREGRSRQKQKEKEVWLCSFGQSLIKSKTYPTMFILRYSVIHCD